MNDVNTKEHWIDRTLEEEYQELVRQEDQAQSWKFPTTPPHPPPLLAENLINVPAEPFEGVDCPQIKMNGRRVIVRWYCAWLNREMHGRVSAGERSRLLAIDPRQDVVADLLSAAGADLDVLNGLRSRMPALKDDVLEALAAQEHDRWSGWEKYRERVDAPEARARWKRQRETPYSQLSEREKESDRDEARKTLSLLRRMGVLE